MLLMVILYAVIRLTDNVDFFMNLLQLYKLLTLKSLNKLFKS